MGFSLEQVQVLRQIFMLVVQTLQQFVLTELSLLSPVDISALVRLLSLAEQILSWDFSYYHILFSICFLKSLDNGHLSLYNIKFVRFNCSVNIALVYTVLVTCFYVFRNDGNRLRK